MLRLPTKECPLPLDCLAWQPTELVFKSNRTIANQEAVVKWACDHSLWLSSQSSALREQTETPIHQIFSERGLTASFPQCHSRVWLQISLHLGADWHPLGSLKELWAHLLLSPSACLNYKTNLWLLPASNWPMYLEPQLLQQPPKRWICK